MIVLPILLAAFFLPAVQSLCSRLMIKGLDPDVFPFTHSHEGVFSLHDDSQKSPIYVHDTKPLILRISGTTMVFQSMEEDSLPQLYVQLKPDFDIDNWTPAEGSFPFSNVIANWIFYDEKTDKYDFLPGNMQLECAHSRIHQCSSQSFSFNQNVTRRENGIRTLKISSNEVFSQLDGFYFSQRPMYQSTTGFLMFYNNDYDSWVITAGDDQPILKVEDYAFTPEYITGKWNVLHEGVESQIWKKRRHLHLECAVSVGDVPGTHAHCSELHNPCHNNANCLSVSSRVYCLCNSGYTGTLCKEELLACPPLSPRKHVIYDGTSQHVGSIAVKFCPTTAGYISSFCNIQENRAIWEDSEDCIVPTTSTTPEPTTTIKTTYPSKGHTIPPKFSHNTPETRSAQKTPEKVEDSVSQEELKGHSEGWTVLALSIAVIVLPFIPLILIFIFQQCLSVRQTQSKDAVLQSQANEIQSTEDQRDREMQTLGQRYPGLMYNSEACRFTQDNGNYTEAQKREIGNEYRTTFSKWENKLNSIEKHHKKQLKRFSDSKTVQCLPYLSMSCAVLFWFWLLNLSLGLAIPSWFPNYVLITGSLICGLSYIFMFVESLCSYEFYILCSMKSTGIVQTYVEKIRKAQPVIAMGIQCYHIDVQSQTAPNRDSSGNFNMKVNTSKRKVITHNDIKPFEYKFWSDSSSHSEDHTNTGLVRIVSEKSIKLDKPTSQDTFETTQRQMLEDYKAKDQFVDYSLEEHVEGLKPEVVCYCLNTPWWRKSVGLFVVLNVVGLSWLYRLLIKRSIVEMDFQVTKTVYCENVDDGENLESYQQEEASRVITTVIKGKKSRKFLFKLHSGNKACIYQGTGRLMRTNQTGRNIESVV